MVFPVAPLPIADLEHIMRYTRPLWREFSGARFFMTGGTGFFGLWLLETLAYAEAQLGLGLKATILTRNARMFAEKAPHLARNAMFVWQEGDVRDFPFPKGEFSHMIHAGSTGNSGRPREMLETILDGTRRVLDLAGQSRCPRLLFISSGAVYGPQPPELERIPETFSGAPCPVSPASAYGEGKRVAELLCTLAAQETGLTAVIARCFAFIGQHLPQDAHYAAGNFLRDALRGGPIRIESDGRPVRSYLHMADLMIWLFTLLAKGKSCQPCNVGSDAAVSLFELASAIRAALLPDGIIQVCQPPGAFPAPRYVPEISYARQTFGLDVRIRLPEAILSWSCGRQFSL
jgi:dTDP-glucose 4,6-dehydratase